MLHVPIRKAADLVTVSEECGASLALDEAAAAGDPRRGFLRAAWFDSARDCRTIIVRRDGRPVAALPLTERRLGPFALREVPGSYWPFRGVPLAADAAGAELDALLASPALGRAWRVGPVHEGDAGLARLIARASRNGWRVLTRRLATSYRVDLAGLAAAGPWPSVKTLRKNRWLERRLAEAGPLSFQSVGGPAWSAAVFDTLAAIEAESWVGDRAAARDTKFLDPANRCGWERAVADPTLAAMLGCSLLYVGDAPAAFSFFVQSGDVRYQMANSYSKRFAAFSPGRILLYRDFQEALAQGVATIDWGAGDPGYKTEMGAEPGPALVDHLFVRGRALAALARPFWERR